MKVKALVAGALLILATSFYGDAVAQSRTGYRKVCGDGAWRILASNTQFFAGSYKLLVLLDSGTVFYYPPNRSSSLTVKGISRRSGDDLIISNPNGSTTTLHYAYSIECDGWY